MKNKKSKIVVPALALILLSTAASISGSVAWFTASRSTQVKTGEFTVVRTGDDLAVALTAGAGIDNTIANQTLNAKENYNLTDASFDHTFHDTSVDGWSTWVSPFVVEPDVPRQNILDVVQLGTGISEHALTKTANLETALNRGTNVYSAYTWDMTFSITFSESSTKNQGLFLDLASADTYMHAGSVEVANDGSIAGLYDNPKCTGAAGGEGAKNETGATKTYYRKPVSSGKGFRIAFIPTNVTSGSVGYSKVWAANEGTAEGEGKYVSSLTGALTPVSYGSNTLSFNGTAFGNASLGTLSSLMKSGDNDVVPNDGTISAATALTTKKNFLGYFGVSAGNTVSLTFTCVAWYEGTHPEVDNDGTLENITSSMRFGVCDLVA